MELLGVDDVAEAVLVGVGLDGEDEACGADRARSGVVDVEVFRVTGVAVVELKADVRLGGVAEVDDGAEGVGGDQVDGLG